MFDRLQDLFKSLNSREVKYLVIGGMAAIAHGSERNTFDLDLLIEPTVENARRLLDAFLETGFGTAALITPEQLVKNEITMFKDRVKIDVQTRTPGIDFQTAWVRRVKNVGHGVEFSVLSLDDLLASKRAVRRPKDLLDLEFFESD